jgi:hypothetical protein
MRLLYAILVLSTIAVIGVAVGIWRLIKGHGDGSDHSS